MDAPHTLTPSVGFLARYTNKVFAADSINADPFCADGSDFIPRLARGTALGQLVLVCATRLGIQTIGSVARLRQALSQGSDEAAALFLASCVARDLTIHPDIASLLRQGESHELLDTLTEILVLIATSRVRNLEREQLAPIPFSSSCIEDKSCNLYAKQHELDDGTKCMLDSHSLYRSSTNSRNLHRAKSAATFSQNPHRLHFSSIKNHAILVLLSWMNYMYSKINNLPRVGEQHYTGFSFTPEELKNFGNSLFGIYKLMGNEGNVEINLKPHPTLKEHFLITKGSIDSFFRVTFATKHSYKLIDFLVFTASFNCPFHDILLHDADFFNNPTAVIIIFSELFDFCKDLAYVIGARDLMKRLTRTKRLTLSQRAKMYEHIPYERTRAYSAKAFIKLERGAVEETEKIGQRKEVTEKHDLPKTHENALVVTEKPVKPSTPTEQEPQAGQPKLETKPARSEQRRKVDSPLPITVDWSEFEVACTISCELADAFPGSEPFQNLADLIVGLYRTVTTTTIFKSTPTVQSAVLKFSESFITYITDILSAFNDLFIDVYVPVIPANYLCDLDEAARCKYLCNYDGPTTFFVHVGLSVLLRQFLFVLSSLFCTICRIASPDSYSFTNVVFPKIRDTIKDTKEKFDGFIMTLCTVVHRYLVLLSDCDPDVNAAALKNIPAHPAEVRPTTLSLEVYQSNAVSIMVNCIISYSLCVVASKVDSFDSIDDTVWDFIFGIVGYLNLSYEIGQDLEPLTDFSVPERVSQLKHLDIFLRNYAKKSVSNAMEALRTNYASKAETTRRAEKLQDFPLWCVLNAFPIDTIDLDPDNPTTYNRTHYWIAVLERVIVEINFMLSELKSTATEGIQAAQDDDSFEGTSIGAYIMKQPTTYLFVASLQRITFQHICDTITLLFKALYRMNNISVERSLLNQLLNVLIDHQDFGLVKLMEGADLLLLSKLNITDPKLLVAMLRVFSKRTKSTIYFSNPFSKLNLQKNRKGNNKGKGKADVIKVQPPDGHTRYIAMSSGSDSSEESSDGGQSDAGYAEQDSRPKQQPEDFSGSFGNQYISVLKPLMNRFKEIAFSYNKDPDILRLFGKTLTLFLGAFPLEFSNTLIESAAMMQILINLYQNNRSPSIFYIMFRLLPYISFADKDLVYKQVYDYIADDCENIKNMVVELMHAKGKGGSIDAVLTGKQFPNRMIVSIETMTLFVEFCDNEQNCVEMILQYLAKNAVLFKSVISSDCTAVQSWAHAYILFFKGALSNASIVDSITKNGITIIFGFLTDIVAYIRIQGNVSAVESTVLVLKRLCDIKSCSTLDILFREHENWTSVCAKLVQIASSVPMKQYTLDSLIDVLVLAIRRGSVQKEIVDSIDKTKLSKHQQEKLEAANAPNY